MNLTQPPNRTLTILGLMAVSYTSIVAALHQLSSLVLEKIAAPSPVETILTAVVFLGVFPAFYIVVKSPWTRSAAAVLALICAYPMTSYLAHEIVQHTQPPGLNKFSLFDALWGLSSLFALIILIGYSVYQMNERAKRKLTDKA